MTVLIRSQIRKNRVNAAAVRGFAGFVMRRAGCPRSAELSILFVGARAMRRLNRVYRGVDRDTDVLAFPIGEGRNDLSGGRLLGDVVISVDRAKKNASEWGTTLNREILLYLVHGILHLRGFGDGSPAARKAMERKQEAIIRAALSEKRWNVIS